MNFLLNRFNEKYPQKNTLNIRFFDEEPLTTRRIRYNQGGAVCYCMENQEKGKQKVSNVWKPINCSEECKYRLSADGIQKPMCNVEGTLKFLLPEISTDRVWLMKITGQTSIKRLQAYIDLQKQLGNSLIGDYVLFLKQEEQTNKQGKTFNNFILDIVKKEDFYISNSFSENKSNQKQLSTTNTQNVNNEAANSKDSEKLTKQTSKEQNQNKSTQVGTKEIEKKITKKVSKEKKTTKQETKNLNQIEENSNEELKNYHILIETKKTTLIKEGKPTEYLVANFVDYKDKQVDVVIPPKFAEELLECDIGTTVMLDLATAGTKTFTNNVEYIQKCKKNVAA